MSEFFDHPVVCNTCPIIGLSRARLVNITQKPMRHNYEYPVKAFAFLMLCSIVGCSERASESSREITGTQTERIAAVAQIINRHSPLPSSLRDANLIVQQYGDGRLGPSDFTELYALTVAPTDLPAWRSALAPLEQLNAPPKYAAPKKTASWWLPLKDFPHLEFYSPKSLTGRIHGWIGIIPSTGKIFVYTFTM